LPFRPAIYRPIRALPGEPERRFKMKRTMTVAAAMLIAVLSSSSQDLPRFLLVNNTGHTMITLSAKAHGTSQPWQDVTFPTIADGDSSDVTMFRAACNYDFRAGYEDGSSVTYAQGTDVCQNHHLLFLYSTLRSSR
jgi:hypothetical protein